MSLKAKNSFTGVDISEIRKMNALAKFDTINLGIGQLPNNLPSSVKERGINAFAIGETRYTSNQGSLELRTLVAAYHSRKCGKVISADQVIITNGAEGALWNILFTYLDRGDHILIPEIAFSVYNTIADLQEAKAVTYKQTEDFSIDFDDLKKKLKNKVKFLVINSPGNPTGTILSEDNIRRLCALAEERDFYIISDEIYSELYFGGRKPFSPLCCSDRVLVVDGISKRAAATGLRIGWTVSPVEICKPMVVANQYITTCASSVSQYAAIASLDGSSDLFIQNVNKELGEKAEYAYTFLKGINHLKVIRPEGAFYIFPDISSLGKSKDVALRILKEVNVLTIPGVAFGARGDRYIRISYAVDFDVLKEALNRIKDLINNWGDHEST
ncbi:MAG: pyridoxal phosphate-dependent aminotransferase [Spirochaetaceae bacterium]|jgi:aspartate/methionine/tyrosine aminotransferase|nr:pyridoxal phosphate-dependent aminotransferase [Spirochaetaceae bacterium]